MTAITMQLNRYGFPEFVLENPDKNRRIIVAIVLDDWSVLQQDMTGQPEIIDAPFEYEIMHEHLEDALLLAARLIAL